jgi:hypothetical protein
VFSLFVSAHALCFLFVARDKKKTPFPSKTNKTNKPKQKKIAGIILDNYARGRRRHLWLSTSGDLHLDAARDLRDLGVHVPVVNGVQTLDRETRALGLARDLQHGVLFSTYASLVSAGGKAGGRGSRTDQIVAWLLGDASGGAGAGGGAGASARASEFDGLVVFDECHKAKNFVAGKEAQSTKVATAVIELQRRLPNARVLYASATGVSEVSNMAYLLRLGLWGAGTAFADFDAFLSSMKTRGTSFLELLALELKAQGKYVARGLSFR